MWLEGGDGTRVPKIRYEVPIGMLLEQKEADESSTEILARYPGCTIAAHFGVRESS